MRAILCAVLLLGLGACAQPPAPAGAPIVTSGPLQGRLQAGVYQDKRDWFSIGTPLAATDPDYPRLSISEEYPEHISYASFEPMSSPGENYWAFVEDFYSTNHQVPSMDQVADSAMKIFGPKVAAQRLEPMRLVQEKPWQTGTTTGLLRLYTERTPIESLLTNLGLAEDYTAYILIYVTAQKGKVAVLWMEWPEDCKPCIPLVPGPAAASQDPIDKALADDGRAGKFMASFHFDND